MSLKDEHQSMFLNAIHPLKLIKDSNNPQKVIEILNHALADEIVLSMRTRNSKWNLHGAGSFELCNLYEINLGQIDIFENEIVSRIKMLQGKQIGSFSEYLAKTRLSETPGTRPGVFQLLLDHESVIRFFREDLRNCSKLYEDISTSEMLIKFIRQHEKIAWILRSFIQKDSTNNVFIVNNRKAS
ncbi:MAG: Dps family protein [Anaerolineaceae bacterium]